VKRAVFLDRDGVLNRYVCHPEFGTIDSPATPHEFVLNDNVCEALYKFRELDFLRIVISNQPGIAKGRFTSALLDATTEKMKDECDGLLNAVYYCLHHPQAVLPEYRQNCDCRKPKPGLLLRAAREWSVDLANSYMIGDGIVDIEAGNAAGVRTIFIGNRKCHMCTEFEQRRAFPSFIAEDLKAVAEIISADVENRQIAREYIPCC